MELPSTQQIVQDCGEEKWEKKVGKDKQLADSAWKCLENIIEKITWEQKLKHCEMFS